MNQVFVSCAVATVGLFAAAAQAATAVSASMSVGASAEVGGATSTHTSAQAWGVALSGLSIGALALAADPADPNRTVTSQGFGNSSWISANAGSVAFEGYGWIFKAAGATSASARLTGAQSDWKYSFVAGATDARFSVAYNVGATGDTFGLWGWSIFVDGGPQGSQSLIVSNASDPTASGTFLALLTPTETYTVRLENNANAGNATGGFDTEGQMGGVFQWAITPVPEPSTYAIMACGLLAVGGALRRNRATAR
jgi:hypothetical protein